jgi:hypothetical protein
MNIIEVEKQEIHGGSVRVTIGHDEPKESVYQYLEFEKDYSKKEVYLDWAKRVKESAWKFKNGLAGLFLNKYKIAGFAQVQKGIRF